MFESLLYVTSEAKIPQMKIIIIILAGFSSMCFVFCVFGYISVVPYTIATPSVLVPLLEHI